MAILDETDSGLDIDALKVGEFPIRVKCATLPWHTLRAALEERAETCATN